VQIRSLKKKGGSVEMEDEEVIKNEIGKWDKIGGGGGKELKVASHRGKIRGS
jgi:hypothetical protein